MDGETLAHSRFSPSAIRAQLRKEFEPAARQPDPRPEESGPDSGTQLAMPDKDDPLPRPGDAYRVHGRHGNKPELTLHFVMKDYAYEGFSYADLQRLRLVPGETPGKGPVLTLRFGDTEVTLEGRHLHSLYHSIGLHRLPWAWEHPSPADFAEEKAAVISRITINQVER